MKALCYCLGTVLLCGWVAGCSGSVEPTNRQETKPAKGVVKLKGSPVAGATIRFVSTTPGVPGSVAMTNDQGLFSMTTYESGDGTVPGNFQVAIVKFEQLPEPPAVDVSDPNYQPPEDIPAEKIKPPKNLLPGKYALPSTSQLQATIGPEGDENLEFNLQ